MPLNNPFGGPQWTDAHIAELSRLLPTGMIYREIAHTLNAQFGTKYSKNSVVGKVCRLGLTPPGKPKAPPYVRKPRDPSKVKRTYRRVTHTSDIVSPIVNVEMERLRCVEIKCETTLADMTGCRYPEGDGPFLFCNGARQAGSSYCTPHFHLTRRAPKPFRDVVMRRFAA